MTNISIFKEALDLRAPWLITKVDFTKDLKQLDIYIDFKEGGIFQCPKCENQAKAYDTKKQKWRHLDFFQHKTYIHARAPRVDCINCGVLKVQVPWARKRTGFTLLFEACLLTLMTEIPVQKVGEIVGEHDTKLWRVLHHYVNKSLKKRDFSKVEQIGADETSRKKGHNYVTLFVDLDKSKTMYVTEGKDSNTVKRFKENLEKHNGKSENIKDVSIDMSPAFISGFEKHFPGADITFDKFHIMKLINKAVDEVRREEQKEIKELKRSRYLWLKNPEKHTKKQKLQMKTLSRLKLKTGRAYRIKLAFKDFWSEPKEKAELALKKWYFWATHSRLNPIIKVSKTIKKHWEGVLQYSHSRINNGVLEGINSIIQSRKRRARGYRSTINFKAIIYLVTGNLNLDLPT